MRISDVRISEEDMEEGLSKFISHNKWFKVSRQVSLSRKRIDLVVQSQVHQELWTIEVKIKDWKTALRQANLNSIACNHSYVAIWHEYESAPMKHKEEFLRLGIGLIGINDNYEPRYLIEPRENNINKIAYNTVAYNI